MVGGQADVKLVSNAMANATRRKIMAVLVEKERTKAEVEQAAGGSMLDYHLQMLEQAGLAAMKEGKIAVTDFGRNFMESKAEKKPAETKSDLSGTKPIEVAELRQLLSCIADSSKFRIIARFEPPLGGALEVVYDVGEVVQQEMASGQGFVEAAPEAEAAGLDQIEYGVG